MRNSRTPQRKPLEDIAKDAVSHIRSGFSNDRFGIMAGYSLAAGAEILAAGHCLCGQEDLAIYPAIIGGVMATFTLYHQYLMGGRK